MFWFFKKLGSEFMDEYNLSFESSRKWILLFIIVTM
jgi:hypothetical protein